MLIQKTGEIFASWDEDYRIYKNQILSINKTQKEQQQFGNFEHIKLSKLLI